MNDDAVCQDSVPLARMPAGSLARPFAGLGLASAFGVVFLFIGLGAGLFSLFA